MCLQICETPCVKVFMVIHAPAPLQRTCRTVDHALIHSQRPTPVLLHACLVPTGFRH